MAKLIDHNARREIFAEAALRVILKEGIAGLTVRGVAKEAGYTTGALTHYFQSKDQLLLQASELAARLSRQRMQRVEALSPATKAIRKVVALALPVTPELRDSWRIWVGFWERSSHDAQVARTMRLRYDEWRGRLGRLLERAKAEGDVAPDVDVSDAADALVALIDGIGVEVLLGVRRIPPARQRAMVDLWLDTLRATPIRVRPAAAEPDGREAPPGLRSGGDGDRVIVA